VLGRPALISINEYLVTAGCRAPSSTNSCPRARFEVQLSCPICAIAPLWVNDKQPTIKKSEGESELLGQSRPPRGPFLLL